MTKRKDTRELLCGHDHSKEDHQAGAYWRGPTLEREMRAAWDAASLYSRTTTFDEWFATHVLGRTVEPDDSTWDYAEYEQALRLGACCPLPPGHPNHAKQVKRVKR